MDSDTIKAAISAVSALVAVASAALAHRAKVQTRRDLFDSQRDALVLAMADNDARCEVLVLQVATAREELLLLHPNLELESIPTVAKNHLDDLNSIEKMTHVLDNREYRLEIIDNLEYSEYRLSGLRRMARNEQISAKQLTPDAFNLIIQRIEKYIIKASKA